ncbi:response regulator [Candidatus Peregrinibacteria bacterium]|nr:response regulator [Candidatus Peregrinibacteria bacterium]
MKHLTKPRVLICEDERFIADLYRLEIESHGVDAEIVSNGKEALEIIKEKKFDLILLDLVMPVMDGFHVLAELKKDKIRIPVVIVITNLSQDINKEKCREMGAEGYIVKSDVNAADVWAKVKTFLPHFEG